MDKTTVIYHSADFDGIFCREIARKFLPDAELIGWNHGDPLIPMPTEGTVYVLDLSPECLDARGVQGTIWNRLVWIDHHATSSAKFEASGWPKIAGYRIDGVAACRLAWQWFTSNDKYDEACKTGVYPVRERKLPSKQDFIDRTVSEPLAVRLAGEYDVWDRRDVEAELFQCGLRSRDLTACWPILLGEDRESGEAGVCDLLLAGRGIQYAKSHENASIIRAAGFNMKFEGLLFLACNHARYNSLLFTAGLEPEHDACLGFCWRGGKWTVSLYHAPGKEEHDLSAIAVKYGGGGHRGACGFQCATLPFLI